MGIRGAILGDYIGSCYEWMRPKDSENCALIDLERCMFTDDTVMTLAVKEAIAGKKDFAASMRRLGKMFPYAGYGTMFITWIMDESRTCYNSWGNGSAMRVSAVAESFETRKEVEKMAAESAKVTHNHEEGVKGAVTTAVCIWMAKNGKSKEEIYNYVLEQYPMERYKYSGKDINYLEKHYTWDVSCMASVPVAMRAVYEADSYEQCMRNLFRLDCDMDTLCCIAGGVTEELFGMGDIDADTIIREHLDSRLYEILTGENEKG